MARLIIAIVIFIKNCQFLLQNRPIEFNILTNNGGLSISDNLVSLVSSNLLLLFTALITCSKDSGLFVPRYQDLNL